MDRLELMQEADRRGLLPPEQKALLDEAVRRGLVSSSKPAVVSAGETIMEVPRQLGLAVRQGAEGLAQVADIGAAPIGGAINTAANLIGLPEEAGGMRLRVPAAPAAGLVRRASDLIGLPTERGPTERVLGDATRLVAGAGGLSGAARTIGGMVSGIPAKIAESFAANPGQQAVSAAGAGLSGGSVREAGGGPLEQFGAAVAGGLSAYGLSALGIKAYDAVSNAIKSFMSPKMGPTEINVMLTQVLNKNGIELSQVPGDVRAQLAAEVKKALDTGKELNPDVIRRLADYGAVGATPTRGTVTLDPVQITQERNLAKVGANSSDPTLQRLARVQNENNAALIEGMNKLGAGTANANPVIAGQAPIKALKAKDAAAEKAVSDLYDAYRASGGEHTRVPQTRLTEALGKVIDEMGIESLPAAVQARLKEFGFLDSKVTRNLTIKEADRFNRLLNEWNPGFGPESRSIAILKNAVNKSLLEVPTKAGEATSGALIKAREAAAARFAAQESGAGVSAALEGVAPDRFVQDFIIGSGPKAATAEVEKMLFQLKGNPQALQAIKENVVSYFKSKALSGAADEVGNFSPSAFNRALNDFGDFKLKLFFSPEEIAQLKAIGRVASYETAQPRGSAVNNSNTAGAVAGLLDRIASSKLVGRIPFGDAALRVPAQNWSAQIGARRAMSPLDASSAAPEVVREGTTLSDLLGPALLLSAPRANGRNDEKRN